jgi:acyl carrier protein
MEGLSDPLHIMSSSLVANVQAQVLRILDDVLSLEGRALQFSAATPLLGAVPELDSMAVVSLITALEEQLGISVDDDEIDGDVFATVGSLTAFAASKLL